MGKITELSPHVSDLIAAGEVVERPASVIKELLENAIDAGASAITAEIENGGITYLRITDNGSGILREDVPTAFLPHATSKLKNAEDLNAITTLGFRGEALAAIASVSRVELFTKHKDEETGTHFTVSGGKAAENTEAGCPDGTTIIVRDLFFNTPARMKFLKKDATEGAYVSEAVERIALSKPEISIKLIKDQKVLFQTPGDGALKSAVYCVYGAEFTSGLIPVPNVSGNIRVTGFVSKPDSSRGNRGMQIFFVNGRYIKSKLLQAALEGAYKNRLLSGRFPYCALNIEVPYSAVDVNVHPAKTEIRFSQERQVFETVFSAVKSALDGNFCRPEIKLADTHITIEAEKTADNGEKAQNPFAGKIYTAAEQTGGLLFNETDTFNHSALYALSGKTEIEAAKPPAEEIKEPEREKETGSEKIAPVEAKPVSFRLLGEILNTYILAEDDEGLLIIDKHAAHERMIFDGLKSRENNMPPQLLLTPEVLSLTRLDAEVLRPRLGELQKLGFDAGEFGESSFIVRQTPPFIGPADLKPLFEEFARKIRDCERLGLPMYDELLHSVSCKAAVKAGSAMQKDELYVIAERVENTPSLLYCPHGRPVAVRLTKEQLEKQFKRIV
ncbi:MAG: DNA mismatch repair endonuclease MutL [Bacillota bacterium]|nr:DNA mismatch repair endonuclease MutL [Bacillota bacterium]